MVKLVAVGDVGQAQHLLGCEAVIDQIVQEEVLEVVRADGVLALLGDLAVARRGQQLGADRRVEHVEQGLGEHLVVRRLGDVAHDHLHHGLGRAGVDVVHGDVVAVVGAPAVGKLAHVLGADMDAAVGKAVGHVHEDLGALARLRILIHDVAVFRVVADVFKVLHDALADVDDAHGRAELLGHDDGVGLRAVGRTEARHGHGSDVVGRQAHHLHGLGADDDGERGVHAAGNADDRVLEIGILHTAHEAGGLHVQQALGRGVIIGRVVRAVGVLAERAGEYGLLHALAPLGDDVGRSIAGEGRVLAARGDEQLHVQLRHDVGAAVLGALEHLAVLGDEAQTGIRRVGARLAEAGSRQHDAGVQLRALGARGGGHAAGGVRRHREARHLDEHGRTGERMAHGRGHRRGHVRADEHGDVQFADFAVLEQLLRVKIDRAEGADLNIVEQCAGQGKVLVARAAGRHDAEQLAVAHGGRRVIHLRALRDRQADEHEHILARGRLDDLFERGRRAREQGVLVEQIAAGGARERQLREHEHLHAEACVLVHGADDGIHIEHWVRYPDLGSSRCNLDKSVFHIDSSFSLF